MTDFHLRPMRDADIPALAEISVQARAPYRTVPELAFVADGPAVDAARFAAGQGIVAEVAGQPAGFALISAKDGMTFLDNISLHPAAQALGIGRALVEAVVQAAPGAVALTTFRSPPWNGPWFRRRGFTPIPPEHIGPELAAIVARQSLYVDPATRELLWRPALA